MNKWLILFCTFLLFAGMLIGENQSAVEKLAAECGSGNQLKVLSVFYPGKVDFYGYGTFGKTELKSEEQYIVLELSTSINEKECKIVNPELVSTLGRSYALFGVSSNIEFKNKSIFWGRISDIKKGSVITEEIGTLNLKDDGKPAGWTFFPYGPSGRLSDDVVLAILPGEANLELYFLPKSRAKLAFLFRVPKGLTFKSFDFEVNKEKRSILLPVKDK
jgi:hypothetical protein